VKIQTRGGEGGVSEVISDTVLGMHTLHRISGWSDIRPHNPDFFWNMVSSRIPDLIAGYQAGYRILQKAGYPATDAVIFY
jgi:hypothetical protein